MMSEIKKLSDNDLIILSDNDEIPNLESDQFKNLSKAEQEAEIDVHDTLFNAKEAGDVLSRFISQFGGGDAPTPSKERLATVRSANKEHADKQVVVVSLARRNSWKFWRFSFCAMYVCDAVIDCPHCYPFTYRTAN